MPKTLGPHSTQGIGFWAQQPYFVTPALPFNKYDWPVPANLVPRPIDQFWGYNGTLRLPQPDLTKVFRGHLKSLPDQLPPPNAFQSWSVSLVQRYMAIPPGITPGEPVLDLAPGQRPPEQVQLHGWTWNYNLNLIGKDRLPVGDQVYDLTPGQRPPEQIQLHSWAWNYNLNLIGKDRLPVGDQVYDLPARPPAPIQSWAYNGTITLPVVAVTRIVSVQLYDLPPSQRVPALVQSWVYNGTITLPQPDNTKLFRGHWRSLPDQPITPLLQTWLFPLNLNLITAPPDLTKQARQQDWPNPGQPYRIDQTWTWSYNLNLIGQDRLPAGKQSTDLPPRDHLRLLQAWVSSVNLALIVQPPNLYAQARQQDWPVPKGYEPDWRRDWDWSYNLNLIGQDQLPPGKQLFELAPRDFARQFQTWVNVTSLALTVTAQQRPFVQTDWPNPTPPAREPGLTSWTASYNLNLIGKDRLPFRQQDWPITPAPQRPNELLTWIERTKLALTTKPFSQTDWPNPGQPFRQPDLTNWAKGFNLNLIGQDRLPRNQTDWPNPAGHTRPTLLQSWQFFRSTLFPVIQLPPGKAFFERPQLRQDVPPDEYWIGERYPGFPPGPPIVRASYRLLSSHYLGGIFYPPNTIITEGVDVPLGWVPTLAVDPLNSQAASAYYAAGPRNVDYGDLNTYGTMYRRESPDVPVNSPVTFWRRIPGSSQYQLQGLGIGFPPAIGG